MTAIEQRLNIRAEMVRNQVTNRAIARECNVRENYVYMVLCGDRTGYRIRRAIAQAVKQPVEVLWPDTPEQYREAA